ncbi:unnamed protein product [Timema podura]|uniref:Uncharacterized protein n=1 Tax=Timema podura TaxID=61482 RepID=A0ABN7PCY3_TIMPD|nr:unnamed protein product [Timema podura]
MVEVLLASHSYGGGAAGVSQLGWRCCWSLTAMVEVLLASHSYGGGATDVSQLWWRCCCSHRGVQTTGLREVSDVYSDDRGDACLHHHEMELSQPSCRLAAEQTERRDFGNVEKTTLVLPVSLAWIQPRLKPTPTIWMHLKLYYKHHNKKTGADTYHSSISSFVLTRLEFDSVADPQLHRNVWKHRGLNPGPVDL